MATLTYSRTATDYEWKSEKLINHKGYKKVTEWIGARKQEEKIIQTEFEKLSKKVFERAAQVYNSKTDKHGRLHLIPAKNNYQLKSTITRYRLDSMLMVTRNDETAEYENVEKVEYTYNENNNMLTDFEYRWNEENNEWRCDYKSFNEYDEQGNVILDEAHYWDNEEEECLPEFKEVLEYDEHGNRTLIEYYRWNGDSESWVGDEKYKYEFNENDKITLYISYHWNNETGQWKGNYKYDRVYDQNGNQILFRSYNWDDELNQWVPYQKYERVYFENGELREVTDFIWVEGLSQWRSLESIIYDEYGHKILYADFYQDEETGEWRGHNKEVQSWLDENNITLNIEYVWNETEKKWDGDIKEEYSYNTNVQLDSVVKYVWVDGQWVFSEKDENEYDENGNNTQVVIFAWDAEKQGWSEKEKKEKIYNASNEKILETEYERNTTTNVWDARVKKEISYHDNGVEETFTAYHYDSETEQWHSTFYARVNELDNEEMVVYYEFDETVNKWLPDYKYEVTYKNDSLMIMQEIFVWDSEIDDWFKIARGENEYNAAGQPTFEIFFEAFYFDELKYEYKQIYDYDENGNRTLSESYSWDKENEMWVGDYKQVSGYDENSNRILIESYDWDEENEMWVGDYKSTRTYHADGNWLTYYLYNWDTENNDWVLRNADERIYDYNYTVDDLILPYEQWYHWGYYHHMWLEEIRKLWDEEVGFEERKRIHYYSEQLITSTVELNLSNVKVFPNPASDNITITWDNKYSELELRIYDAGGRLLIDKLINKHEAISVNKLQSGLYLYQLSNDNELVSNGKISVK